jgi:hypothetical protein
MMMNTKRSLRLPFTPRGGRDTPIGPSRMRWETEAGRGRFRIPRNYQYVDNDKDQPTKQTFTIV